VYNSHLFVTFTKKTSASLGVCVQIKRSKARHFLHVLFTMGCKLFICNCDGGSFNVTVQHIAHDQRRTSHATLLYKLLTRASLPQLQSTSSITSATCPLMPASCSVASLLLHYVTCGGTVHTPHATRHKSHVTRHTSHITRRTSHVTRHASPAQLRHWRHSSAEQELAHAAPFGFP